MVGGWAVYANIFFLYILSSIYKGKQPFLSVILMLALAATLPFFAGVVQDEGSGTILHVVSWGWGAGIWLSSLIILTIATTTRAGRLPIKTGVGLLGVLITIFSIAALIHHQQWLKANQQEREIYLSKGMAFTNTSFCGVPLTTTTDSLLPSNSIVNLEIDPKLQGDSKEYTYLPLPEFVNYQEHEFAWMSQQGLTPNPITVKVQSKTSNSLPVLQGNLTDEGAILRLFNKPAGSVLYEQRLKLITNKHGWKEYCPMMSSSVNGLTTGYDISLLRALGQEPKKDQGRASLLSETARQSCDLGTEDVQGVAGLRSWDGRNVILNPDSIRGRKGFCSENYISLVYADSSPDMLNEISPVVFVFDRKTLKPLALFNDGRGCRGRCKEALHEIITGVRVSNNIATVETTKGDFAASRVSR